MANELSRFRTAVHALLLALVCLPLSCEQKRMQMLAFSVGSFTDTNGEQQMIRCSIATSSLFLHRYFCRKILSQS